ncbi:MAG: citrate/2-methylcitrate synthase, partial [Nannocystaceae bacterium]
MSDTITVTDNRNGKQYELPITDGTVRAAEFRQIKTSPDDFGLMVYDPAFKNTASCRSAITLIDGEKGILRYRGYPIEQLAEKSTFLEVAYLLLNGELPTKDEQDDWVNEVTHHTYIHEFLTRAMEGFKYDAHPMAMMVSFLGALSTFYKESKNVRDAEVRREHIIKIIAKMPTLAAWCYRHATGRPYIYPDNQLSYTGNFLNMLFRMAEPKYEPHPVLERVLDVLFILHADHEQNCSANAARAVGSAETDPYCSLAAAASALYGPLHGGANEAVLRMLRQIGSVKNIPNFIKGC